MRFPEYVGKSNLHIDGFIIEIFRWLLKYSVGIENETEQDLTI